MEPENVNVKWAHGPRPKQKLLDRAREIIRLKYYSIRTERAYLNWMRRDILFKALFAAGGRRKSAFEFPIRCAVAWRAMCRSC